MTRNELLKRLQQMQDNGENMDLELVVRVNRSVTDKRTRSGKRRECLTADLQHACSSTLSWDSDNNLKVRKGELVAELRNDWVGEWH